MHPKEQTQLFGHTKQEEHLLQMIEQSRLPSTLLFSGSKGVGKATTAYRLAKYMLSHENEKPAALFGPATLEIESDSPTSARVCSGAHPDLMVLEPAIDPKTGIRKQEIKVDDVREVGRFLSLTSGEGAWRIVIIDSADALNNASANALLKAIEEPPRNTLMILTAHNVGKLLPTILSRCHKIPFTTLSNSDYNNVIELVNKEYSSDELTSYFTLSNGAPGLAISAIQSDLLSYYHKLISILSHNKTSGSSLTFSENVAAKKTDLPWEQWRFLFELLIGRAQKRRVAMLQDRLVPNEFETLDALIEKHDASQLNDIAESVLSQFSSTTQLHLDKKQTMLQAIQQLAA